VIEEHEDRREDPRERRDHEEPDDPRARDLVDGAREDRKGRRYGEFVACAKAEETTRQEAFATDCCKAGRGRTGPVVISWLANAWRVPRSEEHTSELQSQS